MVEAWQPGGFMRLWWDSLSEQERLDWGKHRSQRMVEAWQPGGFMRLWWDSLSEQERLDWGNLSDASYFPHMRDGWVSKYATAEDARDANRARTAERNKTRAAKLEFRLPDPPGQKPRKCSCLLPANDFAKNAPGKLRKCFECCGAAAALLAEPRFLPKKSDDAWYPTPKALARVANTVTAGFEPGKSPFPRVYDLERDFTPDATKARNKNRAKSSKSAGA